MAVHALLATGDVEVYQGSGTWGALLRVVVALAVVLPLVYVFTRLYSQRIVTGYAGTHLRVIDSVGLGPNRSICLVEVADRILVVGAAADQITLLTELTDPELVEEIQKGARTRRSPAFARMLKESLDRRRGQQEGDKHS